MDAEPAATNRRLRCARARFVVSAGWAESDVLIVEGTPGIGKSLRERGR